MSTKTYADGVAGAVAPDTYVHSVNDTTNYGSSTTFSVGFNGTKGSIITRAFLEFDISDIPAGAIIISASLALEITAAAPLSNWPSHVYRLLRTDWEEGAATWNVYKTATSWDSLGCSTDGVDYTSVNGVAFNLPSGTGQKFIMGLGTLAQDALDNRLGALCLFLRRDTESGSTAMITARSGEYGTASQRPTLTVNYTAGIPILGRRRRGMV